MSAPRISHPTGSQHFSMVTTEDGTAYWFSYETCVAFQRNGVTYVHTNDWGTTTGKHIATIDGGDPAARRERLNSQDFAAALNAGVDIPR